MSDIVLAIVVGHSSKKRGAYNKSLNIDEFTLNENLAFQVVRECLKRGIAYKLIYRENGYQRLPKDINAQNVSHAICIHHNSSSKKEVNGTETLYWKFSKTSDKLAKSINDSMVKTLRFNDRGIKGRTQGERGGHVLRNTSMPCVIIEPYFMSNDKAVQNRNDEVLAVGIVDGYLEYLDYE